MSLARLATFAGFGRGLFRCCRRLGLARMAREAPLELLLDARPLFLDDAVVRRVPAPTALRDHVVAQSPLLDRTDAEQRVARTLVEGVGLELDAQGAKRVERVAHHQQLRLGIDRTALPAR